MSNTRFFNHIQLSKKEVESIFKDFSQNLDVNAFKLLDEGLSTSNYCVTTKENKYLLRVYPLESNNYVNEIAAYKYAQLHVNVPSLLYVDQSKAIIDYVFMICEYIEGVTLQRFVAKQGGLTADLAYSIGENLGRLHQKRYDSMCLLNGELEVKKQLLPVTSLHDFYLKNTAGGLIKEQTKNRLLRFIERNQLWITKLDDKYSFSHGDFTLTNIMVDSKDRVWFIDFEYCLSAPIYYDIGKFFRKRKVFEKTDIQMLRKHFMSGYQKTSQYKLPNDWFELSMFFDICSMLQIINNGKAPTHWAEAVDRDLNIILDELESINLT